MQQYEVNEIYYQGVKDALSAYGIWKNGEQVIGCLNQPVKSVIEGLERNVSFQPPTLDKIVEARGSFTEL